MSTIYFIIGLFTGFITGILFRTNINFAIKRIAGYQCRIIERQMKIFNRQCVIFYILRIRYKNKIAIYKFNKGNK